MVNDVILEEERLTRGMKESNLGKEITPKCKKLPFIIQTHSYE